MVGRMVYDIDTKNGLGARFLWLMTLTPKILTKAADRVLPSNNYNYWTVTASEHSVQNYHTHIFKTSREEIGRRSMTGKFYG